MDKNGVSTPGNNLEALRAWADQIRSEIAAMNSRILPLQQQLDAAKEKLDLVNRLIHLADPSPIDVQLATASPPPRHISPPGIEERIEAILRSSGKPIHIQEIRSSLIQMGVPLPGRGDEANIILRLRRDNNRFVRTGRGTYGLAEWNMPEYSPAPRKKRVSRRRIGPS